MAITKAKVSKKQADVAVAFASAYAEVTYAEDNGELPKHASEDSDTFLRSVLKATGASINVSGCKSTTPFIKSEWGGGGGGAPNRQAGRRHTPQGCSVTAPIICARKRSSGGGNLFLR